MWVSAALLIVMFIDTIITAFLLGKYQQLLREVKGYMLDKCKQDSSSKKVVTPKLDLSNDELIAAARTLMGNRDE